MPIHKDLPAFIRESLSVVHLPPAVQLTRHWETLPDGRLCGRFRFLNTGETEVRFLPDLRIQSDFVWLCPVCATSFTATAGIDVVRLSRADSASIAPKDVTEYGNRLFRGAALGGSFGSRVGDRVEYGIPSPAGPHRKLILRLRGHGTFALGGIASGEIEPDTDEFILCTVPIGAVSSGILPLSLTCLTPGNLCINAIFAADTSIRFRDEIPYFYSLAASPQEKILPLSRNTILRLTPPPTTVCCPPGEAAEFVFFLQNIAEMS